MKKYIGLIVGFLFGLISTLFSPFTFALFLIPLSTLILKIPILSNVDMFESGVKHSPNYWFALILIGLFWSLVGVFCRYLILRKKFLLIASFIIAITFIFSFSFDKLYENSYIHIAKGKRVITVEGNASTTVGVGEMKVNIK